jgi:hypothetical protein
MFKIFNDSREKDTAIKCNDIEQQFTIDSFEASKMPQHALIEVNFRFKMRDYFKYFLFFIFKVEYKCITYCAPK